MSVTATASTGKRKLLVRDALAFLSLSALTLVLLAVTLFLFRSFEAHRLDLATAAAAQGRAALTDGRPQEAIAAYRQALSYKPDQPDYERMLAQALADGGHTEEAYNYFLELWAVHPGDGSINLQLARLAAAKRETQTATNYYRASLYGTWEGDGVERRRAVRLELAEYLIALRQFQAARAELLIAGGNAPDEPAFDDKVAAMLVEAQASADALDFYRKTLARVPTDVAALQGAGRITFEKGEFRDAAMLLARANRLHKDAEAQVLQEQAERALQLAPDQTLTARERVARILQLESIVREQLAACAARAALADKSPPANVESVPGIAVGRAALLRGTDLQAATAQLVYDTMLQTQTSCSFQGDGAVIVLLAKAARTQTRQ